LQGSPQRSTGNAHAVLSNCTRGSCGEPLARSICDVERDARDDRELGVLGVVAPDDTAGAATNT